MIKLIKFLNDSSYYVTVMETESPTVLIIKCRLRTIVTSSVADYFSLSFVFRSYYMILIFFKTLTFKVVVRAMTSFIVYLWRAIIIG